MFFLFIMSALFFGVHAAIWLVVWLYGISLSIMVAIGLSEVSSDAKKKEIKR